MRELVSSPLPLFDIFTLSAKTQINSTAVDHFESHSLSKPVTDDTYREVVAAVAIALAPYAYTHVLVTKSELGRVVLEPENERASYAVILSVKDLVKIGPNRRHHVLLTNMSNKPVDKPKNLIVVDLMDVSTHMIEAEAAS